MGLLRSGLQHPGEVPAERIGAGFGRTAGTVVRMSVVRMACHNPNSGRRDKSFHARGRAPVCRAG
ncbi:MAG: hypothetical protein OEZ14_17455, partial [Acidimicrobiia bacterium]|nr:hypothetical protein [Acidimicrobiia bacterium]